VSGPHHIVRDKRVVVVIQIITAPKERFDKVLVCVGASCLGGNSKKGFDKGGVEKRCKKGDCLGSKDREANETSAYCVFVFDPILAFVPFLGELFAPRSVKEIGDIQAKRFEMLRDNSKRV
jgi:hypothetical protein